MSSNSSSLVVTTEKPSHIEVRLNRPDHLNALNAPLVKAFHDVMTDVTANGEKSLLLTGAGRATCAGMDTDLVSRPDYREQFSDIDNRNRITRHLLRDYPYPTVLAGKGAVIGAGFALSVVSDLVVLGEETHYSYPEVAYDLVAPSHGLEDLVGPRFAKEIQLTGDPIPPDRAFDIGLVNYVVPEDEVETKARSLLERIGEHDQQVVTDIINNFRRQS